MAVELICDNCGQRKVLKRASEDKGHDWYWIEIRSGDSARAFGAFSIREVHCPDCQNAVKRAEEQARKEALAIRAVKGAR